MSRAGAPLPGAADPPTVEAARFADDLARVLVGMEDGPVLLAVSGGPDSMAMLCLAARLPRVSAATVDHRLRGGSADEAAMVAEHCARIGVPHATLVPDVPISGASLQAQAREARYALLARHAGQVGAVAVATAHHADDQAETFLMRAARGSGLAGLAGVRPRTVIAGIAVVRPLLDWRRAELRAVVRRAEAPFVDDPANGDDRHDRTRFRRLLAGNEWLDPARLARSAAALVDADADVRATIDWLWRERVTMDGQQVYVSAAGLPRELRRRLARHAIDTVRDAAGIHVPPWSHSANIESLLHALADGRRATQAGVIATPRGETWHFRPTPPRRPH